MVHTLGEGAAARLADGRALHYMRAGGAGTPTVVFESGLGASRSEWGLVAPIVAQQFPTVVYDRANLGRSDTDGAPRTLERITGDLNELLSALDSGPYILVGHSYGGTIALAAARQDPSRIAGLVLVDHSDEHVNVCCGSPQTAAPDRGGGPIVHRCAAPTAPLGARGARCCPRYAR